MFWEVEYSSDEYYEYLNNMKTNDIVMIRYIDFNKTYTSYDWARIVHIDNKTNYYAKDISAELTSWLLTHNIQYPFQSENDRLLFRLTFE